MRTVVLLVYGNVSVGARLMFTGIPQSCLLIPKAIFVLFSVSSVDEVVATEGCRRWGSGAKKGGYLIDEVVKIKWVRYCAWGPRLESQVDCVPGVC